MNVMAMKRARLGKGLSLRKLAAECGRRGCPVSWGFLAAVERGDRMLGPTTIPIVVEVLELDIAELLPDAA